MTSAYGAGGPTRTEHLVRWLWFLGLAVTIGVLGLRLIVLRGLAVPRQLERRIAVAAGVGALVSLHAGIAAFSLRSEDALQLPFGTLPLRATSRRWRRRASGGRSSS